jgi:hypothetical protein
LVYRGGGATSNERLEHPREKPATVGGSVTDAAAKVAARQRSNGILPAVELSGE